MESEERPALWRRGTLSALLWSMPLALAALGIADSRTTVWVTGERLPGEYFGWPFVWREYSQCCSLEYRIAWGAWLADLLVFLVPAHITVIALKGRWRAPRFLRRALWVPVAVLAAGTLLHFLFLLSLSYDLTFWTLDDHQNAVRQQEWTNRLN
jgi:hypothetical protein